MEQGGKIIQPAFQKIKDNYPAYEFTPAISHGSETPSGRLLELKQTSDPSPLLVIYSQLAAFLLPQ